MNRLINRIKNPNLFVRFPLGGGFFSYNVYPFQENLPFTLNAPRT